MCSCNNKTNAFSTPVRTIQPLNVQYTTVESDNGMKQVCNEEQCGMRYTDILELSKASSKRYKETKDVKFLSINSYFSALLNRIVSDDECKAICNEINIINGYANEL